MTLDTAIGSAITGAVTAAISYFGYRSSEKQRTRQVEANRDAQTTKLEAKIDSLEKSIPPPMVFDASSMSVGQFKMLSGFIAQENEAHMNGRYPFKVDVNRRFDSLEKKIEEGHEKLRDDMRHDMKSIVTSVVYAIDKINPEAATQLAHDLRKTNPPA